MIFGGSRGVRWGAAALAACAVLSGCTGEPDAAREPGPALALLDTLAVKGRAPLTGYDRERFGQAWADVDRNGCDTRNDVLRRDLTDTVLEPGTDGCVVRSGDLASDPYTGARIAFDRTDSAVDIDHVVALADAWQKGAAGWDERKRVAFGNDPLNLLAVDESANRQKAASDAASWLPANKAYRCAYVARQVAVKAKYEVSVTAAERDAIARVLADCPGEGVPSSGLPVLAPERLGVTPTVTPTRTAAGLDPRFPYCYEARDAGYGPYVRGADAEYDWYLDRDSDGRVCE